MRCGAIRIVDNLVRTSLVERRAEPQDPRVARLRITPRGREAVATIHREAFEVLGSILARIGERDREGLLRGLESFIRAVQSLDDRG